MAFAAPVVAYSATLETEGQQFASLFRFVVMPMTLFAGAFFPIEQLPPWLRPVAWLTPVWHGTEVGRDAALGTLSLVARARPRRVPRRRHRGRRLVRRPQLPPEAGPMTGTLETVEAPPRVGLLLRVLPTGMYAGRARVLVERSLLVNRRAWLAVVSGFFEPLFYLFAMGVGFGKLVGDVTGPGGEPISYVAFVAPALLAASAMNGAVYDATFNIFFKFKYAKLYDAMLATPLGPLDVAIGEIAWALLRGGMYAFGFLAVMLGDGPDRLAVGAAGAAGGAADRVLVRGDRHGVHDVHALLAGLRPGAAGADADVPVLHDVLPADRLPRPGAGRASSACRSTTRSRSCAACARAIVGLSMLGHLLYFAVMAGDRRGRRVAPAGCAAAALTR